MYPIIERRIGKDEEREAETEHTLTRDGLSKMTELVDEGGYGAAVAMVTAGIRHHVKEEETELFPELKRKLDRDELAELGDAVVAKKKAKRRAA